MTAIISRAMLAQAIASGAVLVVEALGSDFYRSGHLPTAVNVPLSSSDDIVQRTVTATDLPIVIYGARDGGEAMELAQRFEHLCDRPVFVYSGGKEDWVEAGLAIVGSDTVADDSAGLQH